MIASWIRSALVLAFTLGVGTSRDVRAQLPDRWSADAAFGAAIVKSGEFFNNSRAAARLSVADRLVQRGRLAIYAEAGYDWLFVYGLLGGNPDLVCVVRSSGGGCEPPYPDIAGPSASIGLLYAPVTRVETRVGVGGAAYSVNGTRVGAAVGNLDAAVFPSTHVGLTFAARFAVIPAYRHDRLTIIPLLFGLRVR